MKKLIYKNKSILILSVLLLGSTNIPVSNAGLESRIFSYGDGKNPKRLHVSLKGTSWHQEDLWCARNVEQKDLPSARKFLEYYDRLSGWLAPMEKFFL